MMRFVDGAGLVAVGGGAWWLPLWWRAASDWVGTNDGASGFKVLDPCWVGAVDGVLAPYGGM